MNEPCVQVVADAGHPSRLECMTSSFKSGTQRKRRRRLAVYCMVKMSDFKLRYNHTISYRNKSMRHKTGLSNYIIMRLEKCLNTTRSNMEANAEKPTIQPQIKKVPASFMEEILHYDCD